MALEFFLGDLPMILRFSLIVLCCGALLAGATAEAGLKLPYKAEGLSKEQAAAYLLGAFCLWCAPQVKWKKWRRWVPRSGWLSS